MGTGAEKCGRSLDYSAETSEVIAANVSLHEGMHPCMVLQTVQKLPYIYFFFCNSYESPGLYAVMIENSANRAFKASR